MLEETSDKIFRYRINEMISIIERGKLDEILKPTTPPNLNSRQPQN
jgi:hypothetical protein